jgi:DNA-binding transcriptional LysR family regulator
MDFNTRYFRFFLAVADDLSITRAAVKLAISQPALSQRIQNLEQQVGFPLFHRKGRRVELTANGEALVEPVRGLIGYANRIDRLILDMGVGRSRPIQIRVGMYTEFPERIALLTDFSEACPDDSFETDAGYAAAMTQELLDGVCDLAVQMEPVPDDRFEWIALRWFPVELIVPIESALARHKSELVSPEALQNVWIASFRRRSHPELYQSLIQPLADLGALVSYAPDQSPKGNLAYAAKHQMVIVNSFIQYSDEELASRQMVRRRLSIDPIVALMLVRAKGMKTAGQVRFWEFAERWIAERR